MHYVENQCPVFVLDEGVEYGLTNSGRWTFHHVTEVASGTNASVSVGALRDGAVILVDAAGEVRVVNGPDILGASVYGFCVGMFSLGFVLAIRYVLRVFTRSARIPTPSE